MIRARVVPGALSTGAPPLRAAHATTLRLGAAPLRTQIEALARRARISLTAAGPDPPPAPAHPHGLTDGEAAVLRPLAAGHTNREIGQQLFISPKTASVHVTNILRKLAVRDRVQAAAAARLGLADPSRPGQRECNFNGVTPEPEGDTSDRRDDRS